MRVLVGVLVLVAVWVGVEVCVAVAVGISVTVGARDAVGTTIAALVIGAVGVDVGVGIGAHASIKPSKIKTNQIFIGIALNLFVSVLRGPPSCRDPQTPRDNDFGIV